MWICCLFCVPTWGYFMFVGTGLFVFYQVFPDVRADEMLTGVRKAEEVLPYFVTTRRHEYNCLSCLKDFEQLQITH